MSHPSAGVAPATTYEDAEKGEDQVIEDVDAEKSAVGAKVDYSGFAQKSDPKEIRLVRKLDMYIMVCDEDWDFSRD